MTSFLIVFLYMQMRSKNYNNFLTFKEMYSIEAVSVPVTIPENMTPLQYMEEYPNGVVECLAPVVSDPVKDYQDYYEGFKDTQYKIPEDQLPNYYHA